MTLEQRLYQLEQEVKRLRSKSETWITAPEVLEMTGRDKFWLQRKREDGIIKVKIKNKGKRTTYLYLYESIPMIFLKQTA